MEKQSKINRVIWRDFTTGVVNICSSIDTPNTRVSDENHQLNLYTNTREASLLWGN